MAIGILALIVVAIAYWAFSWWFEEHLEEKEK